MQLKRKLKNFKKLDTLLKSQKVQELIDKCTGFGYTSYTAILKDLYDEIEELRAELVIQDQTHNNVRRIFEELGDVLFVMGNLANRYGINSAKALNYSLKEFKRRIIYCEEHCTNFNLSNISQEEAEKLWKEAKLNK